jgi:hypothetical protein
MHRFPGESRDPQRRQHKFAIILFRYAGVKIDPLGVILFN